MEMGSVGEIGRGLVLYSMQLSDARFSRRGGDRISLVRWRSGTHGNFGFLKYRSRPPALVKRVAGLLLHQLSHVMREFCAEWRSAEI